MRKTNKKGFTIVELVIVIAVIGILATVLIPTFSGVVNQANEAARDANAKAAYTQYIAETKGEFTFDLIKVDDYYYTVTDGVVDYEGEKNTLVEADFAGKKILDSDTGIVKKDGVIVCTGYVDAQEDDETADGHDICDYCNKAQAAH